MDESNALTKLHISVPVWLKNVLQEAAEEKGMSVSNNRPGIEAVGQR